MPNENKEIEQATFGQRVSDRRLTVAFTERITLHMRMRRVFTRGSRVAINSDDVVSPALAEVPPVQHDVELAEDYTFQFDRVGPYGDRAMLHVDIDVVELTLQRSQISEDLMGRRDGLRWRVVVHGSAARGELLVESGHRLA